MIQSDDQFQGQIEFDQFEQNQIDWKLVQNEFNEQMSFFYVVGIVDDYNVDQISVFEGMDVVCKCFGMYVQGGIGIDGYY